MARIAYITRGDEWWGLGHLHRASWLSQELEGSGVPGLELCIFCVDTPQARSHRWPNETRVTFVTDPIASAIAWIPDIAVVDWLDSEPAILTRIKQQGCKLALLDDYGAAQADADLVINALLSPLAPAGIMLGHTRVISGAPYLQFPPEVTKLRGIASASTKAMTAQLVSPFVRRISGEQQEPARAVLISFGGQAVMPAIRMALTALQLAKFAGKVIVIPAPAEPIRSGLLDTDANAALDIEWHPAGPEFHAILAAVDIAVLAGGLSLYEAAFLGVPALCLALRNHQYATALKLEAAGTCRVGGMLQQVTPSELAAKLATLISSSDLRGLMSAKGLALFDGLGLRRTAEAIFSLL